jgi:hypothetical protein
VPLDSTSPEQSAAHLAVLRGSQDRSLNREGIPMVLALVSETEAPLPEVTDPGVLTDGARIADRARETWTGVAAHQRDDDMEVVVTVLHAMAFAEFDAGTER